VCVGGGGEGLGRYQVCSSIYHSPGESKKASLPDSQYRPPGFCAFFDPGPGPNSPFVFGPNLQCQKVRE
jgi:hypothetical protein